MWVALKAELAYFRPWLLGGLGIATGVIVLLGGLLRFFGDENGPPVFVMAMFPAIAGMVVSFIAMTYRVEEKRARMLLAGPLTPRALGAITVLLPSCFVGLAVLFAPLLVGLGVLIAGTVQTTDIVTVVGFTVQFLAYAQLGPLAQEASAARRQQRGGPAIAGWTVFYGAILALVLTQSYLHSLVGHLVQVLVVIILMIHAWYLYQARTDFTR